MDALKQSDPQDLWTKQCAPREPIVITNCDGCPILAIDHKPKRNIVDSKIRGSSGDDVEANVGSLHLLGTNPWDPVTGAITNPNGTSNPMYLLPSIQNDDGTIKDPIQPPEAFAYSPCAAGDPNCAIANSFRSPPRTGKFTPAPLIEGEDSSAEEPRLQQIRHVPHVDKVPMMNAELDSSDTDSDSTATPTPKADDGSILELSSSVHKDADAATPAAGGGFTPVFSDDVAPSSGDAATSPSSDTTTDSASSPSPSTTTDDAPRFTQEKRSEFKGLSSGKDATQSKESTMEVTEFDDNVIGGKRINEDGDDKPTQEEADDKQ